MWRMGGRGRPLCFSNPPAHHNQDSKISVYPREKVLCWAQFFRCLRCPLLPNSTYDKNICANAVGTAANLFFFFLGFFLRSFSPRYHRSVSMQMQGWVEVTTRKVTTSSSFSIPLSPVSLRDAGMGGTICCGASTPLSPISFTRCRDGGGLSPIIVLSFYPVITGPH